MGAPLIILRQGGVPFISYNYITLNSRVRFPAFCGVLAVLDRAEAQFLSTRKVAQSLTPISL